MVAFKKKLLQPPPNRPQVKIYRRQKSGWHYSTVEGLESTLTLEAIRGTLKLSDVYDRVPFSENEATSEVEEVENETLPEG